jgi:aldose 1-epimerase
MKNFGFVLILMSIFVGCVQNDKITTISADNFKYTLNGSEIKLYTLENSSGMICQLTNFGARVVSIYTPDKNGTMGDVVVGYGTGKDFVEKKENYFGTTVGRYGNRIGNAVFSIDSVEYNLEKNDGENHLHGGSNGFHRQIWDVENVRGNEITFSYTSPDMEGGYPGNVKVKVKFQLTDNNELKIEYFAETDKPTILNLTNHTYFNLKDAGKSSINGHELTINADLYTPVDSGLIPTGELADVSGTPFDFRNSTAIGERVDEDHPQLKAGMGYDHNWVLNTNNDETVLAAKVVEPESGRVLEVYTNEPGLQFYGGNFLDGTIAGKNGIKFGRRSAFCLETQHFPDSPNKPEFPDVNLLPGEEYYSVCIYKFTTVK